VTSTQKASYRENFANGRIWDACQKPHPTLDVSIQHIEKYEISISND
jgi:hypothetical protein